MSKINEVKELDHKISLKMAQIIPLTSKFRLGIVLITHTGTAIASWLYLILAYFFIPDYREEVLTIGIITIFMLIPVFILKWSIKRPRPEFKDNRLFTTSLDEYSFPSGHATRAGVMVVMLIYYLPQFSILWVIWALLLVVSRLLLGLHYVSDIIVGLILGIISMLVIIHLNWVPIIHFIVDHLDFLY